MPHSRRVWTRLLLTSSTRSLSAAASFNQNHNFEMSTATTVKKQGRSKKIAGQDEVVVADSNAPVQGPTKKTKTRKVMDKALDEATPVEVNRKLKTTKKTREVKKKETARTITPASTSNRAAKTSSSELQLQDSSHEASQILKQATAFARGKEDAGKVVLHSAGQRQNVWEDLERAERIVDSTLAAMQPASLDEATTKASANAPSNLESLKPVSQVLVKPSSFLNSFLNDPEPAAVHPLQGHQEQVQSPKESRAELKQSAKHDFEDSILSPRGKVKAQSTTQPGAATTPAAVMEPPPHSISSAQLRAFTTSSFAALKSSSNSKSTTPKATTSTPAPAAPFVATTSPGKATPELRKPSFTPPPNSSASLPKPSGRLPTTTASPSVRAYPSGSLPSFPPRRPPPTPAPRPTDLSYDQLQKNAQYRSLRRKWTAVMVSIPFLVFSSYELWRRWDRGDFGRGKMERDLRIEELEAGFDRVTAGAGGTRVKVAEGLTPTEEVSGELLGSMRGQQSDVLVAEAKGTEAVSGRQQSNGATKDIEEVRQDSPVPGRLPAIELEFGSSEARKLLQEGGSKRGWVQVFK